MNEKGKNKYKYFKDVSNNNYEEKLLNRIGILGGGNVGKTFILHKLLGKQYNNKIKTRGISVIYPEIEEKDKLFVCLDTCNTLNTSLFAKNLTHEEVFNLSDKERLNYMKYLIKDQKFRNIFIEDFIIEKANILIIVINQLSFKEQKYLNRLKYNLNFDLMLIIHNLQFFCKKKTIEAHIENVVKKSIFSNLEKGYIIFDINSNDDKSDKSDKPFYYKEKEIGKQKKENPTQEIIHLFMAKEGSEAGNYFNKITIDFIRNKIKTETRPKIFDVIKEVKSFLSECSYQYMIKEEKKDRPILEDEIEKEVKEDDKKFVLKNYIISFFL
jgi:GTPase SAR1 family protein